VQAILLVGGQGTRLRPLTLTTPKPMLPVAGVPFITHQIARLAAAGFDHVVLATSYRAEVFEAHFGRGDGLGVRLSYVTEDEPLGTGGAIRHAAVALDPGAGPIVVQNGDVLSGHDLGAQVACHRDSGAAATLHLVTVDDARAYGCVPTDAAGRVLAFHEKMPEPVSHQINAGCYVLDRSVVDAIPAGAVVSLERETFPSLLADGAVVVGVVDDAYWLDVGTPAAYVQAGVDVVRGIASSPAYDVTPTGCLVDPSAVLHETATVRDGAAIGAGVHLDADADVAESVVQRGARIDAGAIVTRSAIGAGAAIGAGCVVDDAVVGDGARIGAGNELRAGIRVWPDVVLPDVSVRFSSDA
jgi:mannose-1-phosphate guanylyltransferase